MPPELEPLVFGLKASVVRSIGSVFSAHPEVEQAILLPYKIDLSIRDRIDNPELLAHIERVGVSFYHRKKE